MTLAAAIRGNTTPLVKDPTMKKCIGTSYATGMLALMTSVLLLIMSGTALAAINPTPSDGTGAQAIAEAIAVDPGIVTGAGYDAVPPSGTPNGTADAPLSSFPTHDDTFGILTTGNVQSADDPNTSGNVGANLNGPNVRGDTDFDVSVLKLNLEVPQGANCLTLDFQFYSEEFPEWLNTQYNDAFIAELDTSTWSTSGSAITAPNNFAFDPNGNEISINAAGNTSMNAANAAGTTYDGATPLLSASTQVSPGAHSLYLSIFDQGDRVYDSATFVDGLRVGFVPDPAINCAPGAQPKLFSLSLSPETAENHVGTPHTVTGTLLDENSDPVVGEELDFAVTGANTETGPATTDSAGEASFTYTGANEGDDVITACYDADDDGACEATGSATKTWVNQPPDCSTVIADPDSLWPPNHELRLVTLAGATDPDGDPVTIEVTGVTQDEPLNGKADGNTSPDAELGAQPNEVWVRAERAGTGDGRIYEISYEASDGLGGVCEGTVTVDVPHDQGQGSTAVDSGQTVDSLG